MKNVTVKNNTITVVETLSEKIEFTRTWIENVTGRHDFVAQLDDRSVWEKDNDGRSYSYLLQMGVPNDHVLRFETYITARGQKQPKEFIDMFIGDGYIGDNEQSIDISLLKPYEKYHNHNERKFTHVPMYVVAEFFKANDLVVSKTATSKKAEQKTA